MNGMNIDVVHPEVIMDRADAASVRRKFYEGTLKFIFEELVVFHEENFHKS